MSNISFAENKEGYLIPAEESVHLCDFNNPREEAEKWVATQNWQISNEVVLLGLGAGFHLQVMKETHPYLKVHVVECRDALLPIYRKQVSSQVESFHSLHSLEELFASDLFEIAMRKSLPVYFFKPSWGQQEDIFYSFWKNLTGRSVYALARHFANLGIEIEEDTLTNLRDRNLPLTIKDVSEIIVASSNEEAQNQRSYFEILRELVR